MNYEKQRLDIITAAKKMDRYHLTALCGGNVSMRMEDGTVLVTPSGMEYDNMQPEDICLVSADGTIMEAKWRPSSDLAALLYIYAHRADVNAIIHTHQPYATAVGFVTDYFQPCLVTQIDALRGGVSVAPFTISSDIGMGVLTVEYAKNALAVILKNHGVVAFGPTLDCCLAGAVYLEEASQTYLAAVSAHAKVDALPEELVAAEARDMEHWMTYLQGNR